MTYGGFAIMGAPQFDFTHFSERLNRINRLCEMPILVDLLKSWDLFQKCVKSSSVILRNYRGAASRHPDHQQGSGNDPNPNPESRQRRNRNGARSGLRLGRSEDHH
jgi:hypothetical protein